MRALYVVGTPIGNLGDLTSRAREVLTAADRVFAEDTRRTKALLGHLGLGRKPVLRFDAHATPERAARLLSDIPEGGSAALVTDAGMPGVSDPGAALVSAAAATGVKLFAVPGPSAVTAALAVSGLVSGPFTFHAFLPRQGKKRRTALERVLASDEPSVLFEAPSRLSETLRELAALDPARPAVLCRELTKLHEEILHATLDELAALDRDWLGEVTLVVAGGSSAPERRSSEPEDVDREIAERLRRGTHPRELSAELARRLGIARRAAYARILAVRAAGSAEPSGKVRTPRAR